MPPAGFEPAFPASDRPQTSRPSVGRYYCYDEMKEDEWVGHVERFGGEDKFVQNFSQRMK